MTLRSITAVVASLAMFLGQAIAEPTDVTVRVIAKGAKFVGTSMGGARVVIRDAETNAILAQGVTAGSTGDTDRIMKQPLTRGAALSAPADTQVKSSADTAHFTATLDIDAPLKVRVEATGPLAQPQAAVTVTSEQWLVPGRSVTGGDGWLLELPGFAVDILSPAAHSSANGEITITANIVMMCGCPITPGGLWDANDYEVKAIISRDGEILGEAPLTYAGTQSQFAGGYTSDIKGPVEITVFAWNPKDGNTGVDRTSVLVR